MTTIDITLAREILRSRPTGDLSLEQYVMKEASALWQIKKLGPLFRNKKVVFIGDDDHVSLMLSLFYGVTSLVIEIDKRIIANQKKWVRKLKLKNHTIIKHNIASVLNSGLISEKYDAFYANPPYGSKNNGFGFKVWVSRGIEALRSGGMGVIVAPISFEKEWTINNLYEVEKFLLANNCLIFEINRNVHTYHSLLKKDEDLRSSNILVYYRGNAKKLISDTVENLYR